MDPILSLILTGGEPYLRHDLDQIVRIFYENAKIPIITIPSNGWYLKKMDKQIRNMMEWCPNLTLNQQISIDGIGADHNAIRMEQQVVGSDNSFEKAVKTINHIKILQKIYNRINIGIIITFTNQNQNKFKNIIKQIYSLVEPDNISINLVRGNPKQKVNLDLDLELYREAVKYRDNLFYEKKMSGHSRFTGNKFATAGRVMLNELVIKTYEEKKYSTPCYSANLSGVMYPEGDVYPCEILDDSHKIGNIRDFDLNFKKLWLSHKAKKEIKFIRKTKCFCTHECFNSVNIFFNPITNNQLAKIIKFLINKNISGTYNVGCSHKDPISKAFFEGSTSINFLTLGAIYLAHLPLPQPKSIPIELILIFLNGNISKYLLNIFLLSLDLKYRSD